MQHFSYFFFLRLVKYLSAATSTAIVRCARANYQVVWAALTYMTHLPRLPGGEKLQPCVMQVVRVSGTIRKAEEEVIRRGRAAILKARRASRNEGATGLDVALGPAKEGMLSEQLLGDEGLERGVEDDEEDDDDDDDDDEEDQEAMDEND